MGRREEKNLQIGSTPVDDSRRYSYSSLFLIAFRSERGRFVDDGVMMVGVVIDRVLVRSEVWRVV